MYSRGATEVQQMRYTELRIHSTVLPVLLIVVGLHITALKYKSMMCVDITETSILQNIHRLS